MVKRGLDWTGLVKGGLDPISKKWTGLIRARLVKGGLDSLEPPLVPRNTEFPGNFSSHFHA